MQLISEDISHSISLRTAYRLILIQFMVITGILLFTTFRVFNTYYSLSKATDKYIELQETANKLLQASDYLTEEAQCYTVNFDRRHLDNYFEEVEVHKNREKAIKEMEEQIPDSEALARLKDAMSESVSLMDREYHAMILILSATGDNNIPALMSNIKLSNDELQMSFDEKVILAQELMHDKEYYNQKEHIYENMEDCVDSLKKDNFTVQKEYEKRLFSELILVSVLIFSQSAFFIFVLVFTTRTGINPLVKSVNYIKNNQEIPLTGATEFKYVASAYNKVYRSNRLNIEKISYKAFHDELTGLYNRAGYDYIITAIDPKTTAFILIDTDKFKEINDTYGHDIGDKVLCKIADTLRANFRPDDYIFRIGGDEFVVLMIKADMEFKSTIGKKVTAINEALSNTDDGLPSISISAGIEVYYGSRSFDQMYKNADKALYETKDNGRNGYSFAEHTIQW